METIELLENHVLCYINRDSNVAVFTNLPLEYQTGDDWDDAPYEHNAGSPYDWFTGSKLPQYTLKGVRFESDMETPAAIANGNSRYSVDDINARYTSWLTPSQYTDVKVPKPIFAGVTIEEFKHLIWDNNGDIYERVKRPSEIGLNLAKI